MIYKCGFMFSRICKSFLTLNFLSAPQTFLLFFLLFAFRLHCSYTGVSWSSSLLLHLHYNLPLLVSWIDFFTNVRIINVFRFLIFVFYPIGGRRYCCIGIPIFVAASPSFPLPPFPLTPLLPSHKVGGLF